MAHVMQITVTLTKQMSFADNPAEAGNFGLIVIEHLADALRRYDDGGDGPRVAEEGNCYISFGERLPIV